MTAVAVVIALPVTPNLGGAQSLLGNVGLDVQIDAALDAVRCRATERMSSEGALSLLPHPLRDRQRVAHADADNPEHLLHRLDIALDGGGDFIG